MTPLDLNDHLLWPDGDITVTPEHVVDFLYKLQGNLDKLTVTELTPELEQYNQLSDVPLTVKSSVKSDLFPPISTLPDAYKYLQLDQYLIQLSAKIEKDDLYEKRLERLSHEIWLFGKLKLDDVLRTLIYLIDVMKAKGIVWGIGRGSSCSSYLLYLLELHDVDPVRFDIKITDFIKGV